MFLYPWGREIHPFFVSDFLINWRVRVYPDGGRRSRKKGLDTREGWRSENTSRFLPLPLSWVVVVRSFYLSYTLAKLYYLGPLSCSKFLVLGLPLSLRSPCRLQHVFCWDRFIPDTSLSFTENSRICTPVLIWYSSFFFRDPHKHLSGFLSCTSSRILS